MLKLVKSIKSTHFTGIALLVMFSFKCERNKEGKQQENIKIYLQKELNHGAHKRPVVSCSISQKMHLHKCMELAKAVSLPDLGVVSWLTAGFLEKGVLCPVTENTSC